MQFTKISVFVASIYFYLGPVCFFAKGPRIFKLGSDMNRDLSSFFLVFVLHEVIMENLGHSM